MPVVARGFRSRALQVPRNQRRSCQVVPSRRGGGKHDYPDSYVHPSHGASTVYLRSLPGHGTLYGLRRNALVTQFMAQMMENTVNGTDPYLKNFERFEKQMNQPAWLFPLRKAGIACFAEQGFPTLKDEDWRFTNVSPIASLPFKPMAESLKDKSASEILAGAAFTKLAGSRLVFVNGHFAPELSS
ncbi:MAG TPA: hypothetical protein VHC44_17090, partial [Verrucomicrobiae bacterium]|nr:hypothetical protein [Verrucomicrobiae bacterium]